MSDPALIRDPILEAAARAAYEHGTHPAAYTWDSADEAEREHARGFAQAILAAIIEAAARALQEHAELDAGKAMQAALVVRDYIAPLIRAAALEEAATVAENQPSAPLKIGAPQTWIKQQIAAAIRALKAQP